MLDCIQKYGMYNKDSNEISMGYFLKMLPNMLST